MADNGFGRLELSEQKFLSLTIRVSVQMKYQVIQSELRFLRSHRDRVAVTRAGSPTHAWRSMKLLYPEKYR